MMDQLLRYAENYMVQRVMSSHAPLTHVNKAFLCIALFATLCGLVAVGFGLAGFYLYLQLAFPTYQALLIFSGGLMLLCITIFMGLACLQRVRDRKIQNAKEQMRDEVYLNLKLAEQELKELEIFENNPKTCMALASVAGFILAEKTL